VLPSADPHFFEQLFDAAPDAVIVADRSGVIRMANAQARELFGWAPEDLVGRPVEVLLPTALKPLHARHRADYLDAPVARPMAAGVDLVAIRADGTEVPVDISLSPLRSGDERFVAAAIRDATERRAAAHLLEESEQRLRTSLESMLDGFATFRAVREDGRIVDFEWTYINAVGARTYGRPVDELVGERMLAVLPGSDQLGLFARYARVVETGTPWTATGYEYADEGAAGAFDVRAWPLADGFAVTWRDATDRTRGEVELRESEERFRASVEDLHEVLCILTAVRDDAGAVVDLRWAYANRMAQALSVDTSEQLVGRSVLESLPELGPAVFEGCRDVVETGVPWSRSTLWLTVPSTGVPAAFDVRVTKLHDGVVLAARDVTSEREHEEHLQRRRAELERSNREILQLNELGGLLAGCVDVDEAFAVAARSSALLLSGYRGVLTAVRQDGLHEPVSAWGGASTDTPAFAARDCWALRRGQPHVSTLEPPRCPHLTSSAIECCMCVPMTSHGETIGVLHVLAPPSTGEAPAAFDPSVVALATTIARQVALAAGNLQLRDRLHELSICDPLTGLFNRRFMEEALRREVALANRSLRPVAVLQGDLDHFKACNDRYGHSGGDAMLRAVATVMLRTFRSSDVVCRLGGEEFTIILPECDALAAAEKAEVLRREVAHLRVDHLGEAMDRQTISVGVATLPSSARTADDLLHAADAALYAAKREGRDRVACAPAL